MDKPEQSQPSQEQLMQEINRLNNALIMVKSRCFDAEEAAKMLDAQSRQLQEAYQELQARYEELTKPAEPQPKMEAANDSEL